MVRYTYSAAVWITTGQGQRAAIVNAYSLNGRRTRLGCRPRRTHAAQGQGEQSSQTRGREGLEGEGGTTQTHAQETCGARWLGFPGKRAQVRDGLMKNSFQKFGEEAFGRGTAPSDRRTASQKHAVAGPLSGGHSRAPPAPKRGGAWIEQHHGPADDAALFNDSHPGPAINVDGYGGARRPQQDRAHNLYKSVPIRCVPLASHSPPTRRVF